MPPSAGPRWRSSTARPRSSTGSPRAAFGGRTSRSSPSGARRHERATASGGYAPAANPPSPRPPPLPFRECLPGARPPRSGRCTWAPCSSSSGARRRPESRSSRQASGTPQRDVVPGFTAIPCFLGCGVVVDGDVGHCCCLLFVVGLVIASRFSCSPRLVRRRTVARGCLVRWQPTETAAWSRRPARVVSDRGFRPRRRGSGCFRRDARCCGWSR